MLLILFLHHNLSKNITNKENVLIMYLYIQIKIKKNEQQSSSPILQPFNQFVIKLYIDFLREYRPPIFNYNF